MGPYFASLCSSLLKRLFFQPFSASLQIVLHVFCRLLQVKALYVKNIPENTPTEQLKELFQRHGEVTRVVMPPAKAGGKRDFGFVHYAERSSALKAVKDTETYEVNGRSLDL